VTISVGDTVKWTNGGDKGHTVTSGAVGNPDGLWDSGVLIGGASSSQTFTTSGTFQYFCTIHGSKMQATVIVQG
jgi:plastocyanin